MLSQMKNIAQLLVETGAVRVNFENPFLWTSGIKSPIYCDCRELISQPEARDEINAALAKKSADFSAECVAGTATAGIPWAAFVAQDMKLPMLYVRSKPKGHGAGKMVEGRLENGKKILVVEDALSTAGSSLKSVEALRNELEAEVTHVCAIFSWDTPSAKKSAENMGITLEPLTTFGEIVEALLEAEKITADQKSELERFHSDPPNWMQ